MNGELIQEMKNDLVDAWIVLTNILDKTATSLQQNLESQVVGMRHSIRGMNDMNFNCNITCSSLADLEAPQSLVSSIKLKERDLKYRLEEERARFLDSYR